MKISKKSVLVLMLFYSAIAISQNSLDTLKIDKLIRKNNFPTEKHHAFDAKVLKTIQTFDINYYKIVGYYQFPPYKNTIIRSGSIQIRQLTNKNKIFKIMLSDTIHFKDDITIWNKSIHDSTKFLTDFLVRNNQLELSELYSPNSTLQEQFKNLVTTLDPLTLPHNLRFKNIIFYTDQFNHTSDSIASKLTSEQKHFLYNYLNGNYDEFNLKMEKFVAKAISITSIIFSMNGLIYVGADIYGAHYLLTFDSKNWKFIDSKQLWMYRSTY